MSTADTEDTPNDNIKTIENNINTGLSAFCILIQLPNKYFSYSIPIKRNSFIIPTTKD